jgi:hypothetical protein
MSVAAGLPTGATALNELVFDCREAAESNSDGAEAACRDNELGYMYTYNMGGIGGFETGNQTVDGVLLSDVQDDYWSGTQVFDADFAWHAPFVDGDTQTDEFNDCSKCYGWAVRAGDVSAVPVPAAVWLFGSGLIGLVGIARRKKAA